MDGTALILCEGAFGTTSGKTANGLIRYTTRYRIAGVIDSRCAGEDAGIILEGKRRGIPVYAGLADALRKTRCAVKYLVIGLAPDGGRLPHSYRGIIKQAMREGLCIDSGLHDFLSEDEEFARLAKRHGVTLRDIRKPPDRTQLHFYTGKISEVRSFRIAVLGTDSAVGKRTTAIFLNDALRGDGLKSLIIGTGQTSWLQGIKYCVILDSIVNDFVTGEIEHVIWKAWREENPDVMLLEGQGSITNPAYPGGFELLAAGKPHGIILQHAPARRYYDGFPDIPIGDLSREMRILQLLARVPILAITINSENMTDSQLKRKARAYERRYGVPAVDVLKDGCDKIVGAIFKMFPSLKEAKR
jgi:uncharacterized NAD-dependent epimerase/dehydratase family protein